MNTVFRLAAAFLIGGGSLIALLTLIWGWPWAWDDAGKGWASLMAICAGVFACIGATDP